MGSKAKAVGDCIYDALFLKHTYTLEAVNGVQCATGTGTIYGLLQFKYISTDTFLRRHWRKSHNLISNKCPAARATAEEDDFFHLEIF